MSGLRDELTAIYQRQGHLTPALVVSEATPEESPLHHRFEWDNNVAGDKYRLIQARELIRSCTVVYKETDTSEDRVRAFVATYTPGDADSAGYRPTEEVMQDDFASKLVLRQFEREVQALRRSYGHLVEFEAIIRQGLLGGEGEETA